jgi:hypothetical protein
MLAIPLIIVLLLVIFGGKKADEWVPATRAEGVYTTTVTVFGPQVSQEEGWESECRTDANCAVLAGTCIQKDTGNAREEWVDEYEEYAYNIYYEETYQEVYEAQGAEFSITSLGSDDWWQDDFHYVLQEELDRDSCQLSDYTIWVDDPDNSTQEIEVYLSDCEVWDHVTVYERVYEQAAWCQVRKTTMIQMGQQTQQGTGQTVRWAQVSMPEGGRTEQAFEGQVTFGGDDYTFTVTTTDPAKYQDYLVGGYYIGLDDGEPFTVRKNPP